MIPRREFVKGLFALTGAARLSAYDFSQAASESPPETTRIRLVQAPTICLAPQYVAEELLRAEGFSEIEYVVPKDPAAIADELVNGRIDIGQKTTTYMVPVLDAGMPLVVLAGVHVGCYELFGKSLWLSRRRTNLRTKRMNHLR